MGKYKYFDQIIKQDDYLSVVGLFTRELDLLCSDIIKSLVRSVNDWEKEYIFKKDFEEYAKKYAIPKNSKKAADEIYVPNMLKQYSDYKTIYNGFDSIVKNVPPINPSRTTDFANDLINAVNVGGYKANFDLESVDFAGKINLIRVRLFGDDKNIVKTKDSRSVTNQIFDSFLNSLSSLRKEIDGHASVLDRETVSSRDVKDKLYEIYNLLPAVIDDLDNVFIKSAEIKKVLKDFKDYKLDCFIKEYELAYFPELTSISKTAPIDVEEIFSYNIFIEYSAMMSPYNQVLTQKLFEKIKSGNKKIYYDKKSIERLKETVYSKNGILSERARNFQHELNAIKHNVEWLEIDEQVSGSYPTDYIIAMLPRIKGYWCFITADRHFASEIWGIGNDKLIALVPNDDRRSLIVLDKETVLENKNIEYVLNLKDIDNDVVNERNNAEEDKDRYAKVTGSMTDDKNKDQNPKAEETKKEEKKSEAEAEAIVVQEPIYNEEISVKNEAKPLIPVTGGSVLISNEISVPLVREIGRGGEGCIYDIGYGNRLVKIYKEDAWSGNKMKKISEMVSDKVLFADSPHICWPIDIAFNNSGQPIGFMMSKIGADMVDRESCSLENLLTDIRANEKKDWKRSHITDICRQIATGFKKLHSHSIYMGDVNPTNIFINYSKDLLDIRAYFIDVDSYQYKEYTCPVGLKEFTSPRILREHGNESYSSIKRTREDESFAVAVLYYYILFLSEYPFRIDYDTDVRCSIIEHHFMYASKAVSEKKEDSSNIWNNISEKLKALFTDVFCEEKYIDDEEWIEAFEELLSQITDEKKSDIIFPEDFLKDEEDCFLWKTCTCCGKKYQTSQSAVNAEESYICSDCRKMKLRYMRKIYRMECPLCGKAWTANEWDLLENLKDDVKIDDIARIDFNTKIQCPDCDKNFKISGIYSKREESKSDRLRKIFEAAMNNYANRREV